VDEAEMNNTTSSNILVTGAAAFVLPEMALGKYPWHFADVKPLL